MNRRDSMKLLIGGCAGMATKPLQGAVLDAVDAPTRSTAREPVFEWLTFGEVKPAGWIKEQMLRDLREGFAGKLGELCHEASSDIFVSNRNSLAKQNTSNQDGVNWWNGETEGNWRAGHIMMAYLSEDPESMKAADAYMARILGSQDADGYLGAFAPDLRYKRQGELWTQTCLLRGVIAYGELSGRKDALQAAARAADCTLRNLGPGKAEIAWGEDHDLMISDVMERLYQLTGDNRYREFTLWLYDTWSMRRKASDNSLASLLDFDKGWVDHGVHTYETMRVPLWLAMAGGRAGIATASSNSFEKLERYTEASGSAVSQELILNLAPDPTLTEYEYCATREIQFTLESALQKTGRAALGDRIEQVWFNAAQGARLANGRAISYLSPDNRFRCDGRTADGATEQRRNKYSPTHQDAAVCCNPNATQVAALYVRGMWMRHREGGLAALLYGPCKVSTVVNQVRVSLEEQTKYPFEGEVQIVVNPQKPVSFPLYLRDPGWSRGTVIHCAGAQIERKGDYWMVKKTWQAGDEVRAQFAPNVRQEKARNGEVFLQYGSLVFAKEIASRRETVRTYPIAGFEDTYLLPTEANAELGLPAEEQWAGFGFSAVPSSGGNALRPFDQPMIALEGKMRSKLDGSLVAVKMVPLGNAAGLRQVTFPVVGRGV